MFISFSSFPVLFVLWSAMVMALILPNNQTRFILILLAFLLAGIFRYQQSEIPNTLTTLADHTDRSVRIEGRVSTDIERTIRTQQTVLSDVRIVDASVYGKLLVRFPLTPKISYGDIVKFTCSLDLPQAFNGFAYDRQLAAHAVLATCAFPQFVSVSSASDTTVLSRILDFRDHLIARLGLIFPEPHASFIAGLLFGGSSSLSSDLKEDFSRTGTSHILAASGYNVSIFSLLLLQWLLQSPLGRKRGLIVTFVLLILYVIAAGATASVVRAGMMASLLLIQTAARRNALMGNVLLLTLAVMLLINPRLLLDDVGFQLSFAATYGLLFALPKIQHYFEFVPEFFGLRTAFASSCVAIIFTLPILLWHFAQISLIAPLANTIILPLIPFLMALAIVALLTSVLWLPLAQLIAIPAIGLSYAMLRTITIFGSPGLASVPVVYAKWVSVIFAGILLTGVIGSGEGRRRLRGRGGLQRGE